MNFGNFKFKIDFSRSNIIKAVFGFVILIFLLIAYNFGTENAFGLTDLIYEQEELLLNTNNSQSFPIESIEEINVDWKHGDIEVSLIAGTQIVITEMTEEGILPADMMYVQDKYGTIDIDWCEKSSATSAKTTKKLIISIPTDSLVSKIDINSDIGNLVYKDLLGIDVDINLATGNIDMQNASGEEMSISSYSGDVSLSSLQTESLSITANSGKLIADNVKSTSIYARTGEQDVVINGSFESSSVSSTNGNVNFTNTGAVKELNAYSIFGDVNVFVADNEGFFFQDGSTFGESTVEGFEFSESENGRFYKSDEFENIIKITSTDGDITLTKIA